jgi:cell division protein FtsI/penicillin-binding protein 2
VFASRGLERFFGGANGTGLLLDLASRRLIAAHGADFARQGLAPPGSALKPFSLSALMEARKLEAGEQYLCPLKLTLSGRSFTCAHPPLAVPMRVPTAIAYSCNCFVAHVALRFEGGELARFLIRSGFSSPAALLGEPEATGRVALATPGERSQLQALGEEGVLVTPLGLLWAYSRLASVAGRADMLPILEGLEGAVEYGTGQLAAVAGVKVAGKTGTARTGSGGYAAWFCGFAPSRAPSVAVTVMVQGRSGGADAAPVAGRILEAHFAGRL